MWVFYSSFVKVKLAFEFRNRADAIQIIEFGWKFSIRKALSLPDPLPKSLLNLYKIRMKI